MKIMMACNDLILANRALAEWKKEQSNSDKGRQRGAKMYFLRLQLGHLYEVLSVVEEIRKDKTLLAALQNKRHGDALRAFQELEQFLPGGIQTQGF